MDIIGQNGNDGEHYEEILKYADKYDELDLNKDGIVDNSEIESAKQKIKELESRISSGLSGFRKNKIAEELKILKSKLPKDDDDQTKIY